eukprot:TRINITY_DN19829_c0_g1_i1.p1 TRINITY_DN19829_c0_g1~~TRINITY_DN19829_c0_g1_i1.p1  ORF type:complete len:593 (+),score=224.08 TRINITY_DN19829_c0_g1_i1:77-1855(+)
MQGPRAAAAAAARSLRARAIPRAAAAPAAGPQRQPRAAERGRSYASAAAAAAEAVEAAPVQVPISFGPRVRDLQFSIIDSTLREGEQYDTCNFSTSDRIYIAKMLDKLGVEYIEMINPVASAQAFQDCRTLAEQSFRRAKVLTHVRCDMKDVTAAIEAGVHGVNMYMATSEVLVKHSHKKGIDEVLRLAERAIKAVKDAGLEVRFSCEDTFRSKMEDVLRVYQGVAEMGVDRVGIADTVGIATPLDAFRVVSTVRRALPDSVGIEFHAHDDTGCALANALMAIEGGATHIDTCVLGIGERNGIVPLGGLLARLYTINKEATMQRYDLRRINSLDKFVAAAAAVGVPFNNYVTGAGAFTHKAGVHTKAVMSNPGAYEVLCPEDFGVERRVNITNRITGWNAIKARAQQLQLDIADEQIQMATAMIKNLADKHTLTNVQVDSVLMSIAAGPRVTTSDFISWTSPAEGEEAPEELREAARMAAEAVRKFQERRVEAAVAKINITTDQRPFRVMRLQGHIFDKEVLNRAMDICVDSPCDFDLVKVACAKTNDKESTADIKLMANDEEVIEATVRQLCALVAAAEHNCVVVDVTGGD